jgi:hypothetical protein
MLKNAGIFSKNWVYLATKTGQQIIYQPGDDGYYKKGNFNQPRFLDTGKTIIDLATNLEWIKDFYEPFAPYGLIADYLYGYDWTGLLPVVNALNFAGKTGWRMPNINELNTIWNRETGNFFLPIVNWNDPINYIGGIILAWSSTSYNVNNAWFIGWYIPGLIYYTNKTYYGAITIPVRSVS